MARAIGDRLALLLAGAPVLKGVSERGALFVELGDAEMAASTAFKALAVAHEELLEKLSRGRAAGASWRNAGISARGLSRGLKGFMPRYRIG
ncbi:hypothetical protein R3X27_14780 [Tropicimonas sp. TH_r6]|uniref:hypothetical protein n=1 Tax=Tropicimonas sp. TH_r6 TaxID=3082085 RepID=UPI0029541C09|nr:hypothetical protein [Tropicimonas sp. TH_r6]MDV7143950.1 hypothetical protein [Tropicimonas sp. TH_r6]